VHGYIKHDKAIIKHFLADGRVRVSLRSHLNHSRLGVTRVLAGVGEMLQARRHRRIYWVHVVWIVNLFIYLVVAWWIFYRWRNQQSWNFYLFVFVLISPTILYLASMLLFPPKISTDDSVDYKTHVCAILFAGDIKNRAETRFAAHHALVRFSGAF
jgi:hypothetical protein